MGLAGYQIHMGTSSRHYTGAIAVHDPLAVGFVVQGLPPGDYFFAISAVTTTGNQSGLSEEVSGTIRP